MNCILVLSGSLAAGKSSVAQVLVRHHEFSLSQVCTGVVRYPRRGRWIVDAAYRAAHIRELRKNNPQRVHHVHLVALDRVLRKRYAASLTRLASGMPYEIALWRPDEVAATALVDIADVVVDVSETSPERAAEIIVRDLPARSLLAMDARAATRRRPQHE